MGYGRCPIRLRSPVPNVLVVLPLVALLSGLVVAVDLFLRVAGPSRRLALKGNVLQTGRQGVL